jgi:1-deoxy-D-xylulose-5-phosphate reductoisomerase
VSRRRVAILGSTGSIGTQALDVIAQHPDRFEVVALAAGRNRALLQEQIGRFDPQIATTAEDGPTALQRVAVESKPDVVLAATDGAVAFDAVFAAVERGIDIAVANKELIVAAGELLVASASRSGSALLPVDSEHSAIFQCLQGERAERVREIVLTASGGPFWRWSADRIAQAELDAALAHPTWRMGTKNTIDSATMMNKGLEVIEASRLFGLPGDRVRFVVHPQSIAHGFVVFSDGSVKAQLAAPDMRVPIGYALTYPDRLPDPPADWTGGESTLAAIGGASGVPLRYDFEPPDLVRFPCVRLAYEALATGGTMPAVLSAANEVAVAAFVERKIGFGDIPAIIETAMVETGRAELTLAQIRIADRQARVAAERAVQRMERPLCR